jgi:hypothetical protein
MELPFWERANAFLCNDAKLGRKLGAGQEGYVWATSLGSAIKVFERERNFNTELKCYQILEGCAISEIDGFNVPQLLDFDDELWVVEMSVVAAPFLLDFGKCYFCPPEYPSDAIKHYSQQCEDYFGPFWPKVASAIYELERMGIWYVDAKPSNINCSGIALD